MLLIKPMNLLSVFNESFFSGAKFRCIPSIASDSREFYAGQNFRRTKRKTVWFMDGHRKICWRRPTLFCCRLFLDSSPLYFEAWNGRLHWKKKDSVTSKWWTQQLYELRGVEAKKDDRKKEWTSFYIFPLLPFQCQTSRTKESSKLKLKFYRTGPRQNPTFYSRTHTVSRSWPWTRARIFKRLWSPGIDSKASIPPAYVAWRAGTITLFLLGA